MNLADQYYKILLIKALKIHKQNWGLRIIIRLAPLCFHIEIYGKNLKKDQEASTKSYEISDSIFCFPPKVFEKEKKRGITKNFREK